MKQIKLIFVFFLILLACVFSVLNVKNIPISFGFSEVSLPLVIVIIISLLFGVIITMLFYSIDNISKYRENKKLKNTLKKINNRLTEQKKEFDMKLDEKNKEITVLKQKLKK